MTREQEEHLAQIKLRLFARLDYKYRRGQTEHGGNLFEKPSLISLSEEITDLNTYFHCLETHISEAVEMVACLKVLWRQNEMAKVRDLIDELDSKLRDL